MSRSGRLIHRIPFRQQRFIFAPMPLVGVTKRIRLCRCSSLYQVIKSRTHSLAASRLAKPSDGHCGQYFSVRNNDSEYGLSLLTRGRPREGVTPRSYILVSSVTDFIGAPLSECKTSGCFQHCSRMTLRCSNAAACSPHSCSCTSQPTLCGCRCPLSDRGSNTGRARVTASR